MNGGIWSCVNKLNVLEIPIGASISYNCLKQVILFGGITFEKYTNNMLLLQNNTLLKQKVNYHQNVFFYQCLIISNLNIICYLVEKTNMEIV